MKTLEVTSHAGISLKNILFATDFSEASQAALPYAAAIAAAIVANCISFSNVVSQLHHSLPSLAVPGHN